MTPNITGNVTRKTEVPRNTSDMTNDIGLFIMLGKSDVIGAESGKLSVCFTKIKHTKMDCLNGAKNAQIKLPTKHVRND